MTEGQWDLQMWVWRHEEHERRLNAADAERMALTADAEADRQLEIRDEYESGADRCPERE